ncbi:hypothetical protein CC78DRAFT_621178 [Lojkania enalia]|uniref:Uncharacterized protein n=1 Tax=Lojkania enalia TaxID=147567 RepID=A0A9P4MYI4_9PLEO|nr:hypothetical protein CC78DRAFT_621178 [Didymosphaeria enalia]
MAISAHIDTPEELFDTKIALREHKDLLEIIRLLKQKPNYPRGELIVEHFSKYGEAQPHVRDQHRAFDLATRILVMAQCLPERSPGVPWSPGSDPLVWPSNDSLSRFMASTLPTKDFLNLEDSSGWTIRAQLAAKLLKGRYGISFRGTDYLSKHLDFNEQTRIVHIYHHTRFLEECLMATLNLNSGSQEIIPRQLALETLDSIRVLFPWDGESRRILMKIVCDGDLDPDCLEYDNPEYRRADEHNITYNYWSSRLMKLYDYTNDRGPIGLFW